MDLGCQSVRQSAADILSEESSHVSLVGRAEKQETVFNRKNRISTLLRVGCALNAFPSTGLELLTAGTESADTIL